jgi:hypothetical protein
MQVDGFTAAQLGITGAASVANVPSPSAGMVITCTGNTPDSGGYGPDPQRFTFYYDLDFPDDSAFAFATATQFLTLSATVSATVNARAASLTAHAQIELIKQPNPFILHGDPAWLSIDLRVFVARPGDSYFGVMPLANDPNDAPRFISDIATALTKGQGTAGGQSFGDPAVLSLDEKQSKLYLNPTDEHGTPVLNFALAKVHYIGLIGAGSVRVFFRLFRTQVTYVPYDFPQPGQIGRYRRALSNSDGQPIPLAGIEGGEYVTFPFFAHLRINSSTTSMGLQTDPSNIKSIPARADGSEMDAYFGCWLDVNQPNNVLPQVVPSSNVDGPFLDPSNPPQSINQAIVRNNHQCLIAEIAFDPVAIPLGVDPSNWDKLAQRNIIWSEVNAAQAVSTFEFRPTPMGLPARQMPDELMIDWNDVPPGSAAIYIPSTTATAILKMASTMYTSHRLVRVDEHTIGCPIGGITYVPIPPGAAINYPGLLTVDLPSGLHKGRVFNVTVRQITNALGKAAAPPPGQTPARAARAGTRGEAVKAAIAVPGKPLVWRRITGAFQLAIPVKSARELLRGEERQLSLLKWIGEAIPHSSRWYLVFMRYLSVMAGRVKSFGGDPSRILPSPTGDGVPTEPRPDGGDHEHRDVFTGKVAGLIFDHFGDFEGFVLETNLGERRFHSRERHMEQLAERAWRARLRITVSVAEHEPHRPLTVEVCEPPAPLHLWSREGD